MIVVKLQGGLGNQLFQYATGRRLAIKHNAELRLDRTWFTEVATIGSAAPRDYGLAVFPIHAAPATTCELARIFRPQNRLVRRLRRLLRRPQYTTHFEQSFFYDPAVLDLPDHTYLSGYWQHVEYFADIADLIRRDFRFEGLRLPVRAAQLADAMRTSNAVCIHVRRGDYVQNAKTNALHGAVDTQYLRSAIDLVLIQVCDPRFFVFSDDIDWCRRNIELAQPTTFVEPVVSGADPVVDLYLLTCGRHYILSNSSFSWWGAWLGSGPESLIVVPRRWFQTPELVGCTPALPEWIKV